MACPSLLRAEWLKSQHYDFGTCLPENGSSYTLLLKRLVLIALLLCVVPVVPMPLQTEILETMCTEYSLSILIFILNKKGRYHPSNLYTKMAVYIRVR